MTELEIRELVKQASQGNEVAIESLYFMYHRLTFVIIVGILENHADAEDLNQNLWVRLIYKNKLGTFLGNSQFKSWLYRCAINTAFMFLRTQKVRRSHLASLDDILSTQVENPMEDSRILIDPRTSYQEQSILNNMALEKALSQLALGYKAVLLMHDYHGFEHEEIAKELGVHEGTSKSQAYKARHKMQQLLAI